MSFSLKHTIGPDGTLLVSVSGGGSAAADGDASGVMRAIYGLAKGSRVILSSTESLPGDSLLLATLFRLASLCAQRELSLSLSGFPEQVTRQVALALSVPPRKGARRADVEDPWIVSVGRACVTLGENLKGWLSFIGELLVAIWLFIRRRARVPVRDIWMILDECGPGALPIVTLISVLVGVILAFIGAQQLRQFGAQIYVANLVGVAMLREMGAVMAGVIMAGRTGAAFAAQLGTMQVNEEIDALKTLGISPMQYLVVPRVVALIIMMPLLCVYADALGIAGGALVSSLTMDISLVQYFKQAQTAVHMRDLWLGVSKSCVFGVLIAIAGCLSGIRCGRSASAVGIAVTSAVVSGIVAIVLSDAVFAVITEILGI
jgi:phospholipid/cholesterol/gamma-HCH transport system permease protein